MTKAERHKIYKKALELVKTKGWDYGGFCWTLSKVFPGSQVYYYLETLYPELWKRKPKIPYNAHHWFPKYAGKDPIREKILELAIKETKPKSNGVSRGRRVSKRISVSSRKKTNRRGTAVVRRVRKKSKASKN